MVQHSSEIGALKSGFTTAQHHQTTIPRKVTQSIQVKQSNRTRNLNRSRRDTVSHNLPPQNPKHGPLQLQRAIVSKILSNTLKDPNKIQNHHNS